MDQVERLRRNKAAGDNDLFIRAEEIGEYLKAAGMKPTHQELLLAITECNVEDGVRFSVLEKWLKKQVMPVKSRTRNPLLVTDIVGKTTSSSFDLLGKNHVYGVPITRDKEHGAEVIFNWKSSKNKTNDSADMYVDRIKMNIDAVKKGRTTAKEFVEHGLSQKQYTNRKDKARKRTSVKGLPLEVDVAKTFGQLKAQRSPAIKGLIQSEYNRSVTEEDSDYVRSSGSQRTKREERALRLSLKKTKLTRAQRLRDSKIRGVLHAEPEKKFQMRQFQNVPSRLGANGVRVISSS